MRCFHCHEPVPQGFDLTVEIDNQARPMCCHGCAAVATMITGSGLTQFYRLREAPARRPDDPDSDWTIYDRPAMLDAVGERLDQSRYEFLLALAGIRCAACSWLIESALLDVAGLESLSVNAATGRARITLDVSRTRLSAILEALDGLGYRPQPVNEEYRIRADRREQRSALKRLAVAGLGMMQVMTYAVAMYSGHFQDMDAATRDFFRLVSLIVATPVVLYSGWPFLRGAWHGVRHRQPGMDLPVAIAVLAAYSASAWNTFTAGREVYFDSAVMFVFLLSVVRWIEMRMRHRATEIGSAAGEGLPPHALRKQGEAWQRVAVGELEPGDLVRVGTGETVPVDGTLAEQSVEVDESLLTGESTPVHKRPGDPLIAGSLLVSGPGLLVAERVGRNTVYSSIRRLLERARAERPKRIAMADRLARRLVLAVLVLSGATALYWLHAEPSRAFEAALAVLVITCPCALSLATPAVLSAAMSGLAQRGVVVVKPDALERIGDVDRLICDKTGTLTEGSMRIDGQIAHGPVPLERCRSIAAALEEGSNHPIASAFDSTEALPPVSRLATIPGQGVEGWIDGERYRLGRPDFVAEIAPVRPADRPADLSGIALGSARGLLATYHLAENMRADATDLAGAEIPMTILSGDARPPVEAVARRLGATEYQWRQSPTDKLDYVAARQAAGETVAMIGDGNNDAPVLAQADVSITLGSGSALANQQGDVIVATDRLSAVLDLFGTARRTRRLIAQNLGWALAYNLSAVPLAAAGLVPPWLAALGMSASSLLVVLNSLRAGRARTPGHEPEGIDPRFQRRTA